MKRCRNSWHELALSLHANRCVSTRTLRQLSPTHITKREQTSPIVSRTPQQFLKPSRIHDPQLRDEPVPVEVNPGYPAQSARLCNVLCDLVLEEDLVVLPG